MESPAPTGLSSEYACIDHIHQAYVCTSFEKKKMGVKMNMNEERTSQVMTLELQGHYFSYLLLSVIFRLDNGSEDQTLAYFRGKYVKRLLSLRSSQVVFGFSKTDVQN